MLKGRVPLVLDRCRLRGRAAVVDFGETVSANGHSAMVLAAIQLVAEIFGKADTGEGQAMDFEFASDVAPELARRRAIGAFLWVGGFILLVYLLGFPWAVPVFVFSNLHLQSRIGLPVSAALTAATWLFFYGLFQRLLHLPFEDGLIQTLLGV
jgi:hypothetical protein